MLLQQEGHGSQIASVLDKGLESQLGVRPERHLQNPSDAPICCRVDPSGGWMVAREINSLNECFAPPEEACC